MGWNIHFKPTIDLQGPHTLLSDAKMMAIAFESKTHVIAAIQVTRMNTTGTGNTIMTHFTGNEGHSKKYPHVNFGKRLAGKYRGHKETLAMRV